VLLPISGRLEINVKVNEKVKAGETLLILEAMKMANNIAMPFDGTIAAVNVKSGDIVVKNQAMIELKD